MTAPLPVTAEQQEAFAPVNVQPQAPPDRLQLEDLLVAALATYLAARAASAVAGAVAWTPKKLVELMVRIGIDRRAARASLQLAIRIGVHTPTVPTSSGAMVGRAVARSEPIWRARYLFNAAQRMTEALTRPKTDPATGQPVEPGQLLADALEAEKRYAQLHLKATANRAAAAAQVDAAAAVFGLTLGWHAELDTRTTPECRWMHGKNFRADQLPDGLVPGAVHARCRCRAGRPFPGALTVTTLNGR